MIGVAGSSPGVGVTHFAILLANYCHGVRNKKTAVLEWNDSGDFERIREICLKRAVQKANTKTFKVLEISYIKRAGKTELLECMNQGFDTVIIDFGHDFRLIREEFARCDRKFLLGSLCEWKVGAFAEIIITKKNAEGRWNYLAVPANKDKAHMLGSALHILVRQIPEFADAFAITRDIISFFEGIL